MKKIFLLYLFLSYPTIGIGMQMCQNNTLEYEKDLQECLSLAIKPISSIEQDIALGEKVFFLLGCSADFQHDILAQRKSLLKLYLERSFSEGYDGSKVPQHQKTLSIDIQGKKLVYVLTRPDIYSSTLWPEIEKCIQGYCARINYKMSPEEISIFETHIVNILRHYSYAIKQQSANIFFINDLTTQVALNNTISIIWSRNTRITKETQITEKDFLENISTEPELLPVVPVIVEAVEATGPAATPESSPAKKYLTKHQRALEHKKAKIAKKLNEQQLETESAVSLIQEAVEVTPNSRVKQKLEYMQQNKNNIENHEKFFSHAKDCYSCELTRKETVEILSELRHISSDIIVLLYLAKFEIESNKNIDVLLNLFDQAIMQENTCEFIEKLIETNAYSDLIKWVNNADTQEIIKYEQKLLDYSNKTDKISQKKWLSSNIKLLQAIVQKTKSPNIGSELITLCTCFGYDFLDNFIIDPDELIILLREFIYSKNDYARIIERLDRKNKKTPRKVAFECYVICAEKFNDLGSICSIINILAQNLEKNIDKVEYWLRKRLAIIPTDDLAKYDLARILYIKKEPTDIDIHEIAILLNDNKLKQSRIFRSIVHSNKLLRPLINVDREEVISMLEEIIVDPDYIPMVPFDRNTIITRLIFNLISIFDLEIYKNDEPVYLAAKQYNNHESDLSLQEKEELKKIIYNHSLLSKRNGWAAIFTRLRNIIKSANPDISMKKYFENIGMQEIDNPLLIISSTRKYLLELNENDSEYARDSHGCTVLHHILEDQHRHDLAIFLIKNHPKLVNIRSNDGDYPIAIMACCQTDEDKIIEILHLIREISPNIINELNSFGLAPVHTIAGFGLCKVLKYLIEECHVHPLFKDSQGRDIFSFVVSRGHVDVLEYLIKNFPDDFEPSSIIYMASYYGKTKAFNFLLNKLDPANTADSNLVFSCLFAAAEKGFLDIVKAIIESDKNFIEKIPEINSDGHKSNIIIGLIKMLERDQQINREKIQDVMSYLESQYFSLISEESKTAAASPQKTKSTRKKK